MKISDFINFESFFFPSFLAIDTLVKDKLGTWRFVLYSSSTKSSERSLLLLAGKQITEQLGRWVITRTTCADSGGGFSGERRIMGLISRTNESKLLSFMLYRRPGERRWWIDRPTSRQNIVFEGLLYERGSEAKVAMKIKKKDRIKSR